MDSVTQIALGAAVGEATLGHRVGRAAAGWGAVLGTLPDLDIVLYPFLDSVGQLSVHRGLSHSITFAVLTAPLFGWLLARLHAHRGAPPRSWAWLSFLVIGTHIVLDCFTVYGTQVFQPFSDYPVSFDSVFIIDPLYTLPLVIGVIWALVRRPPSDVRSRAVTLGLVLSTAYLGWTLVGKTIADRQFRRALDDRSIAAVRVMTNPTALNSLLWMGMAEANDTLWVGLTSVFDDAPPARLVAVPRRTDLVAGHRVDRAVRSVDWFSKGWWAAEGAPDGTVYMNDWRFGRSDGWLTDGGEPIFRFRLIERGGAYVDHAQVPPDMRLRDRTLERLVDRITAPLR